MAKKMAMGHPGSAHCKMGKDGKGESMKTEMKEMKAEMKGKKMGKKNGKRKGSY